MHSAKDNLIESRVKQFENLSQKIKRFVSSKSSHNNTPFDKQQESRNKPNTQVYMKKSLTDWRKLYCPKQSPVNLSDVGNGRHLDHDEPYQRISKTGHCSRNRCSYRVSNPDIAMEKRNSMTSYSIRTTKKKESLINFAAAQTFYEFDVMKSRRAETANEKKFNRSTHYRSSHQNYKALGNFISQISTKGNNNEENQVQQHKVVPHKMRKNPDFKIVSFNKAHIKDKCKINNQKFMDNSRNQNGQLGQLRYYARN